MRPLGPDDDPLAVVYAMTVPGTYGELERWQVACRLLKDAQRKSNARIEELENRVDNLVRVLGLKP